MQAVSLLGVFGVLCKTGKKWERCRLVSYNCNAKAGTWGVVMGVGWRVREDDAAHAPSRDMILFYWIQGKISTTHHCMLLIGRLVQINSSLAVIEFTWLLNYATWFIPTYTRRNLHQLGLFQIIAMLPIYIFVL